MNYQLYINYTKAGLAIPDHECEEILLLKWEMLKGTEQKLQFNISTENVIYAARALCKRDLIPVEAICFMVDNVEEKMGVTHWGAPTHPKMLFLSEKWLNELLGI